LIASCAAALLLALASSAAPAAELPLVLAFSELAPWQTKDGADRYSGAYTEIARELARRVGRGLQIAECPHRRCLKMMESGAADLSIGLQRSPEREAYMQFLQTPYRKLPSDRVFYVRTGEADRIRRYEDLYGLRVGVTAGSVYFERFDGDKRLSKDAAQANDANLRKLLLGRIDAVVIPEDQGAVLLSAMGLGRQIVAADYRAAPDPTPRSVAVSRRSEAIALLPQLEQAMQAMRQDGTLAALYDKHYYKRYGLTREQVRLE
jgi:polar amino acid transport system substrate-binding protein